MKALDDAPGNGRDRKRLLAVRRRKVAAKWRRVVRAMAGDATRFWPSEVRSLVARVPKATLEPTLVALAGELEDLIALQVQLDRFVHGDAEAGDDLVSALVDGEHVMALMPKGRLPTDPVPAIRRVLRSIADDLVGRLVIQWTIDGGARPARSGAIVLRPRFSPSWGHTRCSLLLGRGRALLVGEAPLPPTWRFEWNARGYLLSAQGVRITGRFSEPGAWTIRAPGREVQLIPKAWQWPLLPPVIDEDGARARPLYPKAGSRQFPRALLARAGEQAERIERARAVLAVVWPEGARTVEDFTHVIIPVTQRELVSYSFAPVPGWSYINLYDRDFVDLIDDLVHENAHHHLNHILEDAPLLAHRPGDNGNLIYYSPWRETLRPLRGILHSVFTFAAGAELFRRLWVALATKKELPHRFSPSERKKIAARCLEENLQIRYSLFDLAHAHRQGRLNARGHALIRDLARGRSRFERLAPSLWRAIRGTPLAKRLARLSRTLDEKRALYASPAA